MLHKALFIFVVGAGFMGVLPVVILGSNQAIEFVDSSAFCTETCHTVHYPEAVTYEASPHSEVACASCHVGEGTGNLVRSKLRGLLDIVPTITGSYQQPIPTPLDNRRPSSETCETCHWSQKFFGDVPHITTTFAPDEANTKSVTTVVLKANGGRPEVATGIHWHSTGKVWYLPLDDKRQDIAWIATESSSGNITEYINPNRINDLTPQLIENEKRQMDCVDCHNRVTHLFKSPDQLIDEALADGTIDAKLPFIKRQGLNALVPQNSSLAQANDKIFKIEDFYKYSYPDVYQAKGDAINKAMDKLQEIARLTTFSDGLDWNTHADNLVHNKPDVNMSVDWQALSLGGGAQGCFRCHGTLEKVDTKDKSNLDMVLKGLDLDTLKRNITVKESDDNRLIQASVNRLSAISDNGTGASSNTNGARAGSADSAKPTDSTAGNLNAAGGNITGRGPASGNTTATINPNDGITDEPGPIGKLDATCSLCHSTYKSAVNSPAAPAVSHPVDGLDNCLICHNPAGSRPFKTTHPWTTNSACLDCHQSAPKLKPLPSSEPPEEAKPTPHSTKNMGECLSCHDPKGPQPIKPVHPWATDDTCAACHSASTTLKPLPAPTIPKDAKLTPHTTAGLDSCLTCHGPSTPKPFKSDHPWATDATCVACHKIAPDPKPLPTAAPPVDTPQIPHSISNLGSCLACHGLSGPAAFSSTHAWSTDATCTACHQVSSTVSTITRTEMVSTGPDVSHSLSGITSCLACHTPGGPGAFPSNHIGRPDSLCLICHKAGGQQVNNNTNQPPPPSLGGNAPNILHSITGLSSCTACHTSSGPALFPATHSGRTDGTCLTCHQVSASVSTPPASLPPSPAILHSITGLTSCTMCHYQSGPAPFSVSHVGWPDSMCLICHSSSATPPTSTPAAPSSLTAVAASPNQVNLTWANNATNGTGFRLERSTSSSFASVTTLTPGASATSYADTTVTASTAYYYRIFATNSAGDSTASSTATVSTPAQGANVPAAPSGLTAVATSISQVTLLWTDNANNETGFRIDRATNSGFTANLGSFSVGSNISGYADTTVAASTSYSYRVFAYNLSGNSASSNTVTVTTPAVVIDAAGLYASDCAVCHGANRGGGTSGVAVTTAALSGTSLSSVVSKLSTGTMAPYTTGWTSAEISAEATWLKGSPPSALSSLSATAVSAGRVDLSWSDSNSVSNETGIRVERAVTASFTTKTTFNLAAGTASYSDTTTAGSTTYYYRVFATNVSGDSPASNVAAVTTPASTGTIPDAPSGLSATAVSATQVNLSWVNNSATQTGLSLDRATNSGFTSGLTTVTISTPTSTIYSDTTVAASTTYYYRIAASNSAGTSAESGTATVTTPAVVIDAAGLYASDCAVCHGANRGGGTSGVAVTTAALSGTSLSSVVSKLSTGTMAPYTAGWTSAQISAEATWLKGGAPSALTSLGATAVNAGQVNLTWSDPNSGSSETGIRVERSTSSAFGTISSFNLAAGVTSYSETTTVGSTTYYYRVFATGAGGDSPASNVAAVTTPASTGTIPDAPSGLSATAVSATQVNLSWVNNSATQTGLSLDRATNSGFTSGLTTVTISTPTSTIYSDTTVAASTTYYYRIAASNSAGTSAESGTATVTTPAPGPAEVYATNCASCHGTSGQGASAPAVAGATQTATISVVRSGAGAMPAYSTTQISASNLTNLATYVAGLGPAPTTGSAIYALNCSFCHGATGQGGSAPSVAGAVTSSNTYVVRGGYLTMPAYPSTQLSSAQLNAVASYVAGLARPMDGATLYRLNCSFCHGVAGRGGPDGSVAGTSVSTTTSEVRSGPDNMPAYTTTQISDAQLANLAAYVNNPGSTTGTAPAAPSNLSATAASSTQVNLTWVDNATNETGYSVQRAGNSSFSSGLTSFSPGANSTSYSDSTTAASTTYYYRVRATNSAGNSAYSNTASVTTPAGTVQTISYSTTIQPMMDQYCNSCHDSQSPRLTTYSQVYSARNNLPGMGSSYLTTAQEQTLANWISQGAPNN